MKAPLFFVYRMGGGVGGAQAIVSGQCLLFLAYGYGDVVAFYLFFEIEWPNFVRMMGDKLTITVYLPLNCILLGYLRFTCLLFLHQII